MRKSAIQTSKSCNITLLTYHGFLSGWPRFRCRFTLWQGSNGSSMRVAAIDLGSNSFHMLIAETLGPSSFETVLQDKMMIQLGKTALVTGRLDPQAMADVFSASSGQSWLVLLDTSSNRSAPPGTARTRNRRKPALIAAWVRAGLSSNGNR